MSGSSVVPGTLSSDPGAWDSSTPVSFGYQWKRCGYAAVVLRDGPSGYWRLGERQGTAFANTVPGAPGGGLTGSYTLGRPGAVDSVDSGIALSGGDGSVPDYPGLDPIRKLTLEWWYRGAAPSPANWLLAKGTPTNADPFLQYGAGADEAGKIKIDLRTNPAFSGDVWSTAVPWPADSAWHYFVVTYDADAATAHLYVDGADRATTNWRGGSIKRYPTPLNLMHSDWLGSVQNGELDEVAVYPVALEAGKVADHYRAATGAQSCVPIAGATAATYQTTAADAHGRIRVTVTAVDRDGVRTNANSALFGPLSAGEPVGTAPPAIAGAPAWGQTLSASTGGWDAADAVAYSYQWRRCNGSGCWDIPGATGPTYVLGLDDVTRQVHVLVTVSNSFGSATQSSDPTPAVATSDPTLRVQQFDTNTDSTWDAENNRGQKTRRVYNNFGWSANRDCDGAGSAGGTFGRGTQPAFYGMRLAPLHETDTFDAAGHFKVLQDGGGGIVIAFYNSDLTRWWRSSDLVGLRLTTGRGVLRAYLEAGSRHWAAAGDAGVNWLPILVGSKYSWRLGYDAAADAGTGAVTLTIKNLSQKVAVGSLVLHLADYPLFRSDGFELNRLGVMPEMSSGDGSMRACIDEVGFNRGPTETFETDPTGPNLGQWESVRSRSTTVTEIKRPDPRTVPPETYGGDFGWSPTANATGEPGELGGVIWRLDPAQFPETHYGDRVGPLDLEHPLHAEGSISLSRAVSDSDSLFGWFNDSNGGGSPVPFNFVGFDVGGKSTTGFPLRPIIRARSGDRADLDTDLCCGRVWPDGSRHHFTIDYLPGASGGGTLTVVLDGRTTTLAVSASLRRHGALLNRFGMVQLRADGPGQTVYYDSLAYTASQ